MKEFISHTINSNDFYMIPERALWWPAQRCLIVADLHLGKATHFNRNGYALPNFNTQRDLKKLIILAKGLEAKSLLVLGDLFHSDYNNEFNLWNEFVKTISPVEVIVVRGNHEILQEKHYSESGITLFDDFLQIEDFIFVHDYSKSKKIGDEKKYFFSGHIHPGFTLNGKGRQSLRLPCFYFGETNAVLPAYGALTGLFSVYHKSENDTIYIIADEKLSAVPNMFKI